MIFDLGSNRLFLKVHLCVPLRGGVGRGPQTPALFCRCERTRDQGRAKSLCAQGSSPALHCSLPQEPIRELLVNGVGVRLGKPNDVKVLLPPLELSSHFELELRTSISPSP